MARAVSEICRALAKVSSCACVGVVVMSVRSIARPHCPKKLRCCSLKLRHCSFCGVASVNSCHQRVRGVLRMPEATARRNRPYAPRLLPEQRREQLLDIVLDVIDTDGVAAVSMDAVARRAGVTRPVVYSQFADANAMLRASLDREERRALAQILDAMPAPGDDDL